MKYRLLTYILFILIGLIPNRLNAQTTLPNNPANLPLDLNVLLKPETTEGWVFLKDSLYVHPDTLFTKYKAWWGLGVYDSIVCIQTINNNNGNEVHKTYTLYHKGLEVYPYQVKVHDYRGKGLIINGSFPRNLSLNINNFISANIAINKLNEIFDAYIFGTNASYSNVQLMLSSNDFKGGADIITPRYRIEVKIGDPASKMYEVFIDAITGEYLFKYETSTNIVANTCTKWYGQQNINVLHYKKVGHFGCYPYQYMDTSTYYCLDTIHDFKFWARNRKYFTGIGLSNDINLSSFGCDSSDEDKFTNQAYWIVKSHIEMIKAKFNYTFKRNFINIFNCDTHHPNINGNHVVDSSNFFEIIISPNPIDNNTVNFNEGSDITIGRKIWYSDTSKNNYPFTYFASQDVIGHEMGHLLINQTANLKLIKESGAINEGYADIFGFITERHLNTTFNTGKTTNWTIGEDFQGVEVKNANGHLMDSFFRDIKNPESKSHPSLYQGQYYIDTRCCNPDNTNDNCGIHINLSILTKWFQLLNDGGTHNQITISAYGNNELEQLIFKTLVDYVTPTFGFNDMRMATSTLAELLHGLSSKTNVLNAWDALGVKVLPNKVSTRTFINANSPGLITNGPNINSVIWTGEKYFDEWVIIDSGYTLIIDSAKLYFGPIGQIFANRGSSLIINNSTLTNNVKDDCDKNKLWKGIKIEPVNFLNANIGSNAALYINNSKIEFAGTAITSGFRTIEDGVCCRPLSIISKAGGFLHIENSLFSNNVTDIKYCYDRNNTGQLNIHNNEFRTDTLFEKNKTKCIDILGVIDEENYLDPINFKPYLIEDIKTNCLIKNNLFRDISSASAIKIDGGILPFSYNDSLNFIISNNTFIKTGHAVFSDGGDNILIKNNLLKNNKIGMSFSYFGHLKLFGNTFLRNDTALHISRNSAYQYAEIFNDSFYYSTAKGTSIYLSGANNVNIHDNLFYEASYEDRFENPFYSIYEVNSKNVNIQDNLFTKSKCTTPTCNLDQRRAAIRFSYNTTYLNYFLRNSITDSMWYWGLHSYNTNLGLKIRCNNFGGNLAFGDAAIFLEGSLGNQGKGCGTHFEPSGNRFVWDRSLYPSSYSLYRGVNFNVPNNLFYYYTHRYFINSSDSSANLLSKPYDFDTLSKVVVCNGNGSTMYSNSCSDSNLMVFLPADPKDPKSTITSKWNQNWQIFNTYKTDIFNVNTSVEALEPFKEIYYNQLFLTTLLVNHYTENKELDSLKDLLNNSPFLQNQIELADLLESRGELNEAKTIIDNLPNLDWELKLFRKIPNFASEFNLDIANYQTIFNILYPIDMNVDNLFDLNDAQLSVLTSIMESGSIAGEKAEYILGKRYNRRFLRRTYSATENSGNNTSPDIDTNILTISPNPFYESIDLDYLYNETFMNGNLKIISLVNPSDIKFEQSFDDYLDEIESNNTPTGTESGENENQSHIRIHYTKHINTNQWNAGFYIIVVYIDGIWKNAKIILKD